MSVDRTREFLSLVDAAGAAKGSLVAGVGTKPHPALRPPPPLSASGAAAAPNAPTFENRSAFLRAIREVSSDLNRTSLKLSALTKLVKKRGMFDDTSAEVERLTLSIKDDMQSQSTRLDGLQEYIASKRHEALVAGARPGKPLPSSQSASQQQQQGASPPGGGPAPADGSAAGGGDLLSSVQGITHGDVIVGQLQGQLLGFTSALRGILQARSEGMRAQADRRQQFGSVRDLGRPFSFQQPQASPPAGGPAHHHQQQPSFGGGPGSRAGSSSAGQGGVAASTGPAAASAAGAGAGPFGGSHNQHSQFSQHSQHHSQHSSDHAVISFGGGGGGSGGIGGGGGGQPSAASAFQQLSQAQLVPESSFMEARAADVQALERHISDLGSLFSRLATVVSEQGALVERIEDNTEDALANMEAGQAQLARYWERVSSNRGLVLRVASMLVLSAVLFALFGA